MVEILADLLSRASPFRKAMLAAKIAFKDGDIDQCKTFLGCAALEAKTDEEHDQVADFVKEKGLRI